MKHYLLEELEVLSKKDSQVFNLLENNTLEGIWYWDLDSPEEEWMSPRFWEVLGFNPKEKRHTPEEWQKLLHPADLEKVGEEIQAYLKSPDQGFFQTILRYNTKDGKTRHMLCRGKALTVGSKKPNRMLGVHIDLSAEVGKLEVLHESYAVQDLLINETEQGVYLFNDEGVLMEIAGRQDTSFDFLPYSEVIGKSLFDIFPKEVVIKLKRALVHLSEAEPVTMSYELDYGLSTHHFLARLSRLGPNRIIAVARDITSFVNREEELSIRNRIQNQLLRLSSIFANTKSSESGIDITRALGEIGPEVNADRLYIFEYDLKNNTVSNTHEWCAEGVEPQTEMIQEVPMEEIDQSWIEAHLKGLPYGIYNVQKLEEGPTKRILQVQGIKSLLTYPMMLEGELFGFVRLDWVHRYFTPFEEHEQLLKFFAELLTVSIQREKVKDDYHVQDTLANDLLRHVNIPYVLANPEGQLVKFNEAFLNLIGYTREEVLKAERPFPWWREEDRELIEEAYQLFFREESYSVSINIKHKDNSLIPVTIESNRVVSSGRAWTIFTIIDEKKHEALEKSLKEAQYWLRQTQDKARVGHFVLEFKSKKFKLSETLTNILGLKEGNQDWDSLMSTLFPKGLRKSYSEEFWSHIQHGDTLNIEVQLSSADAREPVWLNVNGHVNRSNSGAPERLIAMATDITESVKQRKKTEDQNERLKEIAWIQSHETRAPLARILSLVESLEIDSSKLNCDQAIGMIKKSAEEFDAIISKVISRAERIDSQPEGPSTPFERVILVDDDPIVVMLAQKLMERANISVPVSNYLNGKEFIDALGENTPSNPNSKNLVILDLNMPEMNGWEVLDYLLRERYEDNYVVNILTSSISNHDRVRAEKYLFVKGYLEKPMNAEMVDELIRRYPSLRS